MPRTRVTKEMRDKARALRHQMTRSETALWQELRELRKDGLKFRRQAPIGPYVVDFVCLAKRLVIEVDGDSHEKRSAKRHDGNRDAYLKSLGYDVVRFPAPDVSANAWHCAQQVRQRLLDGQRPHPS